MDCICNGAYMFVIYMQKSKDNTFQKKERNEDEDSKFQISGEKIEEISKIVKDELISVLKSLKGFEVFYLVKVNHNLTQAEGSNDDTRSIDTIEMMKEEDKITSKINYFFI